jgi:hypothetical protein
LPNTEHPGVVSLADVVAAQRMTVAEMEAFAGDVVIGLAPEFEARLG